MGREKSKLTVLGIKRAGIGKLQDGGGLVLDKGENGGKWIWRYSLQGDRREMGLGGYPFISLAEARQERDQWAKVLQSGADPISARNLQREKAKAERNRADPTFEEIAEVVFEARKSRLRGDGERGRWFSPLRLHAMPKLGRLRLSKIHQTEIRDCLLPIWRKMPATAEKTIQRIGIVFKDAKLMGLECDPFTVEAARHMLGDLPDLGKHIVSTPWRDIPNLFTQLDSPSAGQQCLRLMILTSVRFDGVAGALFSEIDGDVWTIPADRVKGREGVVKAFRVPLSDAALAIIAARRARCNDDRIFPSYGRGSISNAAILNVLNDLGEAGRPHGFRTSFRTWTQDTQACSEEVAEAILSHKFGNKVRNSYARSDLLDQRAAVMDKWAEHVTGARAVVVRIRRGSAPGVMERE